MKEVEKSKLTYLCQMELRFSFILSILIGLFSCVKQENGDFQREFRMSLEIPADANPLFTHIFEQRIASSWIQFLKENNLNEKDIKSVKPRSIILTPIFDNSINYDLIAEAHASVYPVNNFQEYLPIADVYDPVGNNDELIFLPGLADVKEIVSQPEFVLRLALNVRVIPGSVSEHYLTVQFDVFLN